MIRGIYEQYCWLEVDEPVLGFVGEVLNANSGNHLYITAFDSGHISPAEEESKKGWVSQGEVMVSPRLGRNTEVPYDNFDEWYFFPSLINFPKEQKVFVNYGRFSLVPVKEQLKRFDSTWGPDSLDWLQSLQDQFWEQIMRLEPETYVAMGDRGIVVSKNLPLLERIRASRNK
ncbi:hypothetical protein [Microbulbifer pacificus]|uniref:Uncharacterized protein n=1 Tax=Microbulbifer pacificus TaxID=407164 RepID=A0AAU0MXK5_9GAMM|nr:hypothetical protein [Microbulbifer pacificus]WOX04936.1 hypothetical protein R5R33_14490 [Microbulbifer pacificus]